MKKFFTSTLVLAIVVGFSSCAVEKTIYNDGTALEWHKKKVQSLKTAEVAPAAKAEKTIEVAVVDPEVATDIVAEVATNEAVVQNAAVGASSKKVASAKSTSIWDSPRMQDVQSRIEHSTPGSSVEYEAKVAPAAPAPAPAAGGKSQLVALLLCILVGGLGIHRFYLGYTWQGVVQLLTAGGCGVWWLIDLIRIITGDLKPKDGGYDKTL